MFEVNEDPEYSAPVRVSLRNLFAPIRIIEAREMTLSGNQERHVAESRRFRWHSEMDPYEVYASQLNQLVAESAGKRNKEVNKTKKKLINSFLSEQLRKHELFSEFPVYYYAETDGNSNLHRSP